MVVVWWCGGVVVVVSPMAGHDSTLLASGSYDKTVKLWQADVGQLTSSHTLDGTAPLPVQCFPFLFVGVFVCFP